MLSDIVRRFEDMDKNQEMNGKRVLNEDQSKAFRMVMNNYKGGGSALVLGSSGTGKSICLSAIKKHCDANNITCDVTASTGKAASAVGGVTLHSYIGLKMVANDSAENADDALKLKRNEDMGFDKPDILIVEEVGMVGVRLLREIKKIGFNFIVYVGDKEQLQPVKDTAVDWLEEADYYTELKQTMRTKDERIKQIFDDFREYKQGTKDDISIQDYINGDNIVEIDYSELDTIDANSQSCFVGYRNKLVESIAQKITHQDNTMMNLNAGVTQTVMTPTEEKNSYGVKREFVNVHRYYNGEDVKIDKLDDVTKMLQLWKKAKYGKWNLSLTKSGIMIKDGSVDNDDELNRYFISFPPDAVLECCTLSIIDDDVFILLWDDTEQEKDLMHDYYFKKLHPYLEKKREADKEKREMFDEDERLYKKGWKDFLSSKSTVSARPVSSRTIHKAQGISVPCTIISDLSFYGASRSAQYVAVTRCKHGLIYVKNTPKSIFDNNDIPR